MSTQQKISPFLWFDGDAEVAANHYVKALPNGRIVSVERYGEAGPGPSGSVMMVQFEIAGQAFFALNGGPQFKPNESVSFLIACENQAEVDRLWEHMSLGGSKNVCGWLKDKWGFSWQIVPRRFFEMMADPDMKRKNRVFAAMMQMHKFDLARLEAAYAG